MKKVPSLFAAAIILVFLFSGCIPEHPVKPAGVSSIAQVSLVYASTPMLTSPILVSENGKGVFGAGYGSPVVYAEGGIPSGSNVNLTFYTGTPQDSILYSSNFNLVADSNYTVFLGGPASNPCHLFVQNDMSVPAPGMAKVRFVNLSSDSYNFNCFKGSVKLDSGFTYQSVAPFIQLPADSMASFIFADATDPNVHVSTGTFLLNSGGIYTIVLAGNFGAANFWLATKIIYLNPKVTL